MFDHMFRFGYGADIGIFGVDSDTGIPGIQLTTPVCIFIKQLGKDEDYVRYEIDYYETPSFWDYWIHIKGFNPEDGESYLMALFIEWNNSDAHRYPETYLYWQTSENEAWTYEAPDPFESKYGNILEMVPDVNDGTQLIMHDPLVVDTDGNFTYTFKSDNSPFGEVGGFYGVSMTKFGKLFINGVEYQIETDSYTPELWYIINFKIVGFTPVSGQEYEILFSIDANDDTGKYCNDRDGYFALNTITHIISQ